MKKDNIDLSKFVDVGGVLKKRRLELNISEEDIAKKLKIRQETLTLIENGDVTNLMGRVYYQGVISKYSQLIGLKHEKILEFVIKDVEKFNTANAKKILSIGESKRKAMSEISLRVFCTIAIIMAAIIIINTTIRSKYSNNMNVLEIKAQEG